MDPFSSSPYILLWKKYRPVILKMMIDARTAPQAYQLFPHEIRSITPKGKSPGFTLQAQNGRTISRVKSQPVTDDLLHVLSSSPKAIELMQDTTYEFSLGRDCRLQVAIVKQSVADQ